MRACCIAAWFCLVASSATAQPVSLPGTEQQVLDNGLTILLHEKHDVPLIGLTATIRGGGVTDPDGKAGLSSLVAGLLEKGAGDRDAAAFAEAVDAVGGSLRIRAGLETITITAEFLARDSELLIELIRDMLRSPTLSASETAKLRDRRVDLLRAARDGDPRQLMAVYGNAFLFGDHPYGRPVDGDETSLASISARDVRTWYEDYIGANRLIIAVAGDFDAAEMTEALGAAFGDWGAVDGPLPEVPRMERETGRRVLLVDKPGATQSYFWMGNVGVSRDYAKRAELDIANLLFAGRFSSLLVEEMRTRAGLTYGVRSPLRQPEMPGSVAIESYTRTESTIAAIDLALSLLDRMRQSGFGPDLIESGKNYLLGLFPLGMETAVQLAGEYGELAAFGHDSSWVNAYLSSIETADSEATLAVINEVYPDPSDLVFAVIGDAAQLRDALSRYGPVSELAITEPVFSP